MWAMALVFGMTSVYAQGTKKRVEPGEATMRLVKMGKKTFNVANQSDERHVYREQAKAENCFIVISKQEFRLYVYEVGRGDMKTPESTLRNPFKISQIQPASSWKHDFKDGRGNLPAYGAWFLRLVTPGHSGIGIHGSTSNESSVPGRDSEGCIRLRDADIKHLKEHYARVGTAVVIKSDEEGPNRGPYDFEKRAWKKAKDFAYPTAGYTLLPGATFVD